MYTLFLAPPGLDNCAASRCCWLGFFIHLLLSTDTEKEEEEEEEEAATDCKMDSIEVEGLHPLPGTTREIKINNRQVLVSPHEIELPADHFEGQRSYVLWLPLNYTDVQLLERKKFSIFCSVRDSQTGNAQAMQIYNLSSPIPMLTILRELKIAKYLFFHKLKSIVLVKDIELHVMKGVDEVWYNEKIVIIYENGTNLEDFRHTVMLEEKDYKKLLAQMLLSLQDLHNANIVHRNINPCSFLVDSLEERNLKLCDFARASHAAHIRHIDYSSDDDLNVQYQERNNEIQDRMAVVAKSRRGLVKAMEKEKENEDIFRRKNELIYRAGTSAFRSPEILLGCVGYGKPTDVWAVGCLFALLVRRRLLFDPKPEGKTWVFMDKRERLSNEQEFNAIIMLLGSSFIDEVSFIDNPSGLQLALAKQNGSINGKHLPIVFEGVLEVDGIELLGKLLKFDPRQRISVEDALRHPYLKDIAEKIEKENKKEMNQEVFNEIKRFFPQLVGQFEMVNHKEMNFGDKWNVVLREITEFLELKGQAQQAKRMTERARAAAAEEASAQKARATAAEEEEERANKKQKA